MENLLKFMETISSIDEKNVGMEEINRVCNAALELTKDELEFLPKEITFTIEKLRKAKDKLEKEEAKEIKLPYVDIIKGVENDIEYGLIMFSNYNRLFNGTNLIILNKDLKSGMIVGKRANHTLELFRIANDDKTITVNKTESISDLTMLTILIQKTTEKDIKEDKPNLKI